MASRSETSRFDVYRGPSYVDPSHCDYYNPSHHHPSLGDPHRCDTRPLSKRRLMLSEVRSFLIYISFRAVSESFIGVESAPPDGSNNLSRSSPIPAQPCPIPYAFLEIYRAVSEQSTLRRFTPWAGTRAGTRRRSSRRSTPRCAAPPGRPHRHQGKA